MTDLMECQLDLLKELDRVCEEHGLRYFLFYGTLLGAVRHKGFIPWDDDLDVMTPVEDYNELNRLTDFKDGYFLQNRFTDKEYGLMISRLRNSNTTLIEKTEKDRNINHGVFIDIYPLYNIPTNSIRWKRNVFSFFLCRLLQYERTPRNYNGIVKLGAKTVLRAIKGQKRKKLVDRIAKSISNVKRQRYGGDMYGYPFQRYEYSDFFPLIKMDFESFPAYCPSGYDNLLKTMYGDYMELPPEEERVFHHDYEVLDLNKPYTEYYGTGYCVSDEVK